MEQDDRDLREILRDFSRALSGAIAESPDLERSLRRIRREGYSLQLTVGCARVDSAMEPVNAGSRSLGGPSEPAFRIDVRDLSFLRSIGIDPTRRLRRRKS
jgi:hypothetical protein